MTRQIITPHLWYDKEAKEAAELYVSAFGENSKINNVTTIHNTPSGSTDIVAFDIFGQEFMAISAGPLFKFNPSISFHVKCKTKDEVDTLWEKLSADGKILMDLGEYPFSERYGWTEDRYGLSWQLIHTAADKIEPRIIPVLMFVGDVCGKSREAVSFYTNVFRNARAGYILEYGQGEEPDLEGTVKYAAFTLEGQEFGTMDSAYLHDFNFNEAISLMVSCDTQQDIDHYWDMLSALPEAEQCGWLKDKFGLSWQIVPSAMDKIMANADEEVKSRVTEAFLKMKKFDISELERAAEGK